LIMLGGYGAFWLWVLLGFDPLLALPLVVAGALALGVLLYWGLFAFVVRAHEEMRIKNSLLIGFGLALATHALAVRLWTADERSITTTYAGAVLSLGPIAIPLVRLASLVLAFALIGALHLLLQRWRWGRAIRATAEDWEAAALTGIDVRRAYLLAFAIGTGLAGAAGTLVSVGYSISPSIGLEWTLKALIVVVLAGLGSMLGTFVGGLVLGLLSVALAQSWNVVAGYAGQINLGHAAFFGLGALVTRTLWIAEWPVLAGAALGALAATAFALLVGAVAFRLRGAYFAIGTLALGEILRITVGNVLPEVSTLPTATIGAYRLADPYYFA